MTTQNGLSIGIEHVDNDFFLKLRASGKLTHEDYQVISPMLDSALEGFEDPHIRAMFDVTEMQGWEARAAWDDFKLGIKHGRDFDRVAIYGNKNWQKTAAKVGDWFISGDIQYFEDEQQALSWLRH